MMSSDPFPVLLLLRAHLEGRQRQGEKRLWLREDAAQALREIVRMKPRPMPVPAAAPAGEIVKPVVAVAGAKIVPMESPKRLVLPERAVVALTLEEKESRLAEVRRRAEEGEEARQLGTLRSQCVFSSGSAMARILFLGDAPGPEEERAGAPFVGQAGVLLTNCLKVMGLQREEVYLTTLCKYRPAMEDGASNLRDPSMEEMASGFEIVREEIAIIQPKVVVVLGGVALAGLLGVKRNILAARGEVFEFEGVPVVPTLHPAYLARMEQEGPVVAAAEKRKFWEDMLLVMERVGLPISAKQRAFFLPK